MEQAFLERIGDAAPGERAVLTLAVEATENCTVFVQKIVLLLLTTHGAQTSEVWKIIFSVSVVRVKCV